MKSVSMATADDPTPFEELLRQWRELTRQLSEIELLSDRLAKQRCVATKLLYHASGMPQLELAELLGISQSRLSQLIRGKRR
jgi:predicted XRE-type DNA-binding protein